MARPRLAALAAALLTVALSSSRTAADPMALVVPAYQYPTPGTLRSDLAAAAPRVPVVAILDPANGPGTLLDPNYTTAVNALRAAGGRVCGYVWTHYAARGADTVLADAARYDSPYSIDGWFVDEVTPDAGAAHLAYYRGLRAGLRALAPARPALGNPGQACDSAYAGSVGFDELVTCEDGATYGAWTPDPWMAGQPPARFVQLVHGQPDAAAMVIAVAAVAGRGAGGVFVTDDTLPNPWDTTPPYRDAEVAAIARTTVAPLAGVAAASADRAPALRADGEPARGTVTFAIAPTSAARTLRTYDVRGRAVARLAVPAASRAARWDATASRAAPGLYFATLGAGATARVVLVR